MKQKLAAAADSDGLVICTFADRNYCILLRHWLKLAGAAGRRSNVLVFCLDQEAADVCDELGASYQLSPFRGPWLGFLRHRMGIAREIVRLGYSPLMSDLDALWLRDPLPFTTRHPQDLVFSPGTIQPREVHAAWGNVLCMGYCLLRTSSAVLAVIDAAMGLMNEMGDQPALKRVLFQRKVEWQPAELYALPFRERQVLQSRETRFGQCGDLSIALLPNRLFQRLSESCDTPLVVHPIAPKVEADKMALFRKMGLCNDAE
jgi:hypothetical protein